MKQPKSKSKSRMVGPAGAFLDQRLASLLDAHLADRGFCSDMSPLLGVGITYDPRQAGGLCENQTAFLVAGTMIFKTFAAERIAKGVKKTTMNF